MLRVFQQPARPPDPPLSGARRPGGGGGPLLRGGPTGFRPGGRGPAGRHPPQDPVQDAFPGLPPGLDRRGRRGPVQDHRTQAIRGPRFLLLPPAGHRGLLRVGSHGGHPGPGPGPVRPQTGRHGGGPGPGAPGGLGLDQARGRGLLLGDPSGGLRHPGGAESGSGREGLFRPFRSSISSYLVHLVFILSILSDLSWKLTLWSVFLHLSRSGRSGRTGPSGWPSAGPGPRSPGRRRGRPPCRNWTRTGSSGTRFRPCDPG